MVPKRTINLENIAWWISHTNYNAFHFWSQRAI